MTRIRLIRVIRVIRVIRGSVSTLQAGLDGIREPVHILAMRLCNLQALRGVACLLVLFFHIAEWELHKGYTPSVYLCYAFEFFGYAGVDLFFVLSGFIITWVSFKKLGDPRELVGFLLRRAWRIYPLYWICWGLWAVGHVVLLKLPLILTARWLWSNAFIIPSQPQFLFIPQAWSLAYEVLFYGVFAVFFILPRRAFLPALGVWLVSLVACALVGWPPLIERDPLGRSFALLVNPKVIEFVLGCFVAVALRTGWGMGWGRIAFVLGVAGFAGGGLLEYIGVLQTKINSLQRVIAFGIPSTLLAFGATAWERRSGWTLPRWLQSVGDASYSIYLVHGGVLEIMQRWLKNMSHSLLPHMAYVVLLASAALLFGFAMHKFVEVRLMSIAQRRKPARIAVPLRRAA